MSTTTQQAPVYAIQFAGGINDRPIIIQTDGTTVTIVSDGECVGWSRRLVRRAYKRNIIPSGEINLWSAIVEGTTETPPKLDETLQQSFDSLMKRFVKLEFNSRVDLRKLASGRMLLMPRLRLKLVRPASSKRYAARLTAEVVSIYRASIGSVTRIA